MSQQTVEIVIDRLLADEELRARFALDRMETLLELSLCGFDFTPSEIDVFMRTDARVWFAGTSAVGWRAH